MLLLWQPAVPPVTVKLASWHLSKWYTFSFVRREIPAKICVVLTGLFRRQRPRVPLWKRRGGPARAWPVKQAAAASKWREEYWVASVRGLSTAPGRFILSPHRINTIHTRRNILWTRYNFLKILKKKRHFVMCLLWTKSLIMIPSWSFGDMCYSIS